MPETNNTSETSQSTTENVKGFVSRNKWPIIGVLATIVAAGIYAVTRDKEETEEASTATHS